MDPYLSAHVLTHDGREPVVETRGDASGGDLVRIGMQVRRAMGRAGCRGWSSPLRECRPCRAWLRRRWRPPSLRCSGRMDIRDASACCRSVASLPNGRSTEVKMRNWGSWPFRNRSLPLACKPRFQKQPHLRSERSRPRCSRRARQRGSSVPQHAARNRAPEYDRPASG